MSNRRKLRGPAPVAPARRPVAPFGTVPAGYRVAPAVKVKRSRFAGNVLPVRPREADRVADLIARHASPAWRCVQCFLSDCTPDTPTPGCEGCACVFCAR